MKTCGDMPERLDFEGCCDSCHEDASLGYADMVGVTINHEDWYLCCAQLRNLDKMADE